MAKTKDETEEASNIGHNADRERALLVHHLEEINKLESKMATAKAKVAGAYKAAKADGILKKDIQFAQDLHKDDDNDMLNRRARERQIALWFQHPIGTQTELFDVDRTPVIERAFEAGKTAGMAGKDCKSPHAENTEQGQKWIEGWQLGQTAIFNIKKTETDSSKEKLIKGEQPEVKRDDDDDELDNAANDLPSAEENE